jgi:sarcosine oxidase
LLQETGQVSFGHDLQPMIDAMRAAGVPPEPLTDEEARTRFPAVAVDAPAVFEPESGVLLADRCLAALRDCESIDLREGHRVVRVDDDVRGVTVVTDAIAVRADAVIVTAGPWSARLVPALANSGLFTTLEHVAYLRARADDAAATPVFIAHDPPACYGLPSPVDGLYKVGLHHAGTAIDPDRSPRAIDPQAVHAVEAAVRRFLPGFVAEPALVETCVYDNTPDEDFVVDRIGNVLVGAGTSGHGFKFGPLLGEVLADLATGAEPRVPIDAFALRRSALAR